jgi:hypothetical protein
MPSVVFWGRNRTVRLSGLQFWCLYQSFSTNSLRNTACSGTSTSSENPKLSLVKGPSATIHNQPFHKTCNIDGPCGSTCYFCSFAPPINGRPANGPLQLRCELEFLNLLMGGKTVIAGNMLRYQPRIHRGPFLGIPTCRLWDCW